MLCFLKVKSNDIRIGVVYLDILICLKASYSIYFYNSTEFYKLYIYSYILYSVTIHYCVEKHCHVSF